MLEPLKGNFEEDENGIGLSLSLSIGGNYSKKIDRVCNSDDKILIERQRSKKRAIHREMMENEEFISKQTVRGNECCTLNLSLNHDSYVNNQNLAVHNQDCRGLNENKCGNVSYNECRNSESEGNLSGKSSFENCRVLSDGSVERCSSSVSVRQSLSPIGRSSNDKAQGNQPGTSGRNHAQFEHRNIMPIKEQTEEDRINFPSDPLKQQNEEECDEIKNGGMIQLLSRMPCVSASGNSPNAKKINGILCKYNSKTEIKIVCLCHGKSFTPSEFVEHAGGVDVSQPLRHITVIPSCFPRNTV